MQLTVIVAITPGGLGINEAGWIGVLTAMGLGAEEAASYAVAFRVVQVVTFGAGAVATMALGAWQTRLERVSTALPAPESRVKTQLAAAVGDEAE